MLRLRTPAATKGSQETFHMHQPMLRAKVQTWPIDAKRGSKSVTHPLLIPLVTFCLLCISLPKLKTGIEVSEMPVIRRTDPLLSLKHCMPLSVFFFWSLTGDVAQPNDPIQSSYPDSLSPSWLGNPILRTHGEPAHQLPASRYSAEWLRIPSRSQPGTAANLANNVDAGISSLWQSAGFFHRNVMHLMVYFEIKTNISKNLAFKTLPENYSGHTTINLFFKNNFCSFGRFILLNCVQVLKTMEKAALSYKQCSVKGKD